MTGDARAALAIIVCLAVISFECVGFMGAIALNGLEIPQALVAIASGAVGALAGALSTAGVLQLHRNALGIKKDGTDETKPGSAP